MFRTITHLTGTDRQSLLSPELTWSALWQSKPQFTDTDYQEIFRFDDHVSSCITLENESFNFNKLFEFYFKRYRLYIIDLYR